MQVSVEVLDGLERRMTVSLPADSIDGEVNKRLRDYAKQARIDGFRPGKVPMKLMQRKFGAAMRQEVLGEQIEKSYFEALSQESLNPAGMPSIDTKSAEAGADVEYVATFEVFPEIETADLSGVTIDKEVSSVGDEQVDDMIERLRQQRKEFQAVERAAGEGDQVTLDYVGHLDGEVVEEAKQDDAKVVVGEGRLLEDFEKALSGVEAGQEIKFDVKFPEDYPAEKVKGQTLNFEAAVKEVAEAVLPEVDEEFAKAFGVEDGSIDGLRDDIRKNMQRELDDRLRATNKDVVMDALLDAHDIHVPKALIDDEVGRLKQADENADADELEKSASRRVKLGLVIRHIVQEQEMAVDQERLMQRLESIAGGYDNPSQIMAMYQNDKSAMQELEGATLEDQIVDWVYEQSQANEIVKTFDEVMNPAPAAE